jgi:predicted PurR-regulated permease PerM
VSSEGERFTRRRVMLIPLVAVLLLAVYLAFLVFQPFLLDLTVAGSAALLLAPLQRRLARLLRGRQGIAAGLIVLATTVVILLPVTATVGLLSQQVARLVDWLRPYLQPHALQGVVRDAVTVKWPWLGGWVPTEDAELSRFLATAGGRLAENANAFVQAAVARFASALFQLVLFILTLFFLLRDGARLRTVLEELSPLTQEQESAILGHLERTVQGVLVSMILVPIAQGIVAFFGFVVFGVPAPLLWSVVVVLAALVPVIGSPLGWVPAVIYLLATGATWQWVGMLLYGLLGISVIDNIIKPLVLREAANIHPLLAFLSILGGVIAFGPMGFLIGPVILSFGLSAVRIYRSDILRGDSSRSSRVGSTPV